MAEDDVLKAIAPIPTSAEIRDKLATAIGAALNEKDLEPAMINAANSFLKQFPPDADNTTVGDNEMSESMKRFGKDMPFTAKGRT